MLTSRLEMSTDPRKLAAAFADNVAAYLGPDELAEANRRNAEETRPDVCHTHDFCDANVLMLEAMESQGIEFDPSSGPQADFCNAAWRLAKAAGFDPHAFD